MIVLYKAVQVKYWNRYYKRNLINVENQSECISSFDKTRKKAHIFFLNSEKSGDF